MRNDRLLAARREDMAFDAYVGSTLCIPVRRDVAQVLVER